MVINVYSDSSQFDFKKVMQLTRDKKEPNVINAGMKK